VLKATLQPKLDSYQGKLLGAAFDGRLRRG
jgi:hypothetical protein